MNEKRKNYCKFFEFVVKGEVLKVIIIYLDRFICFGFKIFEFFFKENGLEIIVINEKEKFLWEEFIEDLIIIILYFVGKFYGMCFYKYKKFKKGMKKLIEEVEND